MMQLRAVTYPSSQWSRAQQFINSYNTVPDFRISRHRHRVWLLEETTGGEFDEVTEEITGRDIGGVLVVSRESFSSEETLILVHPNHREQRWGYRMLRWLLDNVSDMAYGRVNVNDAAGMAFAAKYGSIGAVTREGGAYVATVMFSYQNRNWRHGGCRCHYCIEEISSLTNSSRAQLDMEM